MLTFNIIELGILIKISSFYKEVVDGERLLPLKIITRRDYYEKD
jgi:hypothetical protein